MDPRLARCEAPLSRIAALAAQACGDAELGEMIAALRARVASGGPLDDALPDAFALAGEACRRMTGETVTRQQFTAAAALHFGLVAQVEDGAGRDVAVLLAAVLGALEGRGVHVMTTADHLARRHAARARAACDLLGLRVGLLTPSLRPPERKDAYYADITYGMANEFAYDYLRDNMGWSRDDIVQRGQRRALVNDADIILIDQYWITHIMSGPVDRVSWAEPCARLATMLIAEMHYVVPKDGGPISLTDEGVALAASHLGVADVYGQDATVINAIRMALRAKERYLRGRDYDVVDGRIVALDGETGAPRTSGLSSDLCRALQAKEGLPVGAPAMHLATITPRGYLRRYPHLSGIGGSVADIPEGFQRLYGLDVVTPPAHRPTGRVDHDDRLFLTDAQRDNAVLAEVLEHAEAGRPVVIGTVTMAAAHHIVAELTEVGMPVRVVSGTDPERDAATLRAAGQAGAITVVAPSSVCRDVDTAIDGLVVFGVGRHRSRRHDAPLRGLAGRNGTSGECAFFLSIRELAGRDGVELPAELPPLPDGGLQNSDATGAIAYQQREEDLAMVERCVLAARYDEVRQQQRDATYEYRGRLLASDDMNDEFQHMISDVIDRMLAEHLAEDGRPDQRAVESLLADAIAFPITAPPQSLIGATRAQIRDRLRDDADRAYRARSKRMDALAGPGTTREVQRRVILSCLDRAWREYLTTLDQLYEDVTSAGSVADKLAEFRAEATAAYQAMWPKLRKETVGFFFHLEITTEP